LKDSIIVCGVVSIVPQRFAKSLVVSIAILSEAIEPLSALAARNKHAIIEKIIRGSIYPPIRSELITAQTGILGLAKGAGPVVFREEHEASLELDEKRADSLPHYQVPMNVGPAQKIFWVRSAISSLPSES
jgi:hypothetical protein